MNQTNETGLFDLAKSVSALDAAERLAGVRAVRVGRRAKACCPLHSERTPSCVFYENGSFYCFGCHAGGSSIDCAMAFFHESCTDATKRIVRAFGLGEGDLPRPQAARQAKDRGKLSEQVLRTASFTHAVQCAVIHWCDDQLETVDRDDDSEEAETYLASVLALRNDAANLTDAINALEDANRTGNLSALLRSVEAVCRERYGMLKTWDEAMGTCYVRGMRA